jgi:tetrahydromethanopterin S-methyltransferase subunit G
VPAVDGPELTPATRKRTQPDVGPVEPVPAAPAADDGARFVALETAVRSIDVRLEHLERTVTAGFQEAASRSLVVAEATDEVLARIEDRVSTAPIADDDAPPAGVVDVGERLVSLQQRVDELAEAVLALAPTIEAILDLRSDVTLVGERLGDLLGGPSLTEIMDRLDEIEERRNR